MSGERTTLGISLPATMKTAIEALARDRHVSVSLLARAVFATVLDHPDVILPTEIEAVKAAEEARIESMRQAEEARSARRAVRQQREATTRRRHNDISPDEIERRFQEAKAAIRARRPAAA